MNRRKIPKRISSGLIGVLVIWVLVGLGVVGAVVSTPIVEEPLGENSAQTIAVGDEVVEFRTETSKTYYLGNSTYRLISTGPLHYEDEQGDWQQIDNAIVGGQMLKDAYHLSIIQEDFDEGQVLEWSVDGEFVKFQPMALGWTNDYDQIQQISMPQAVTASVVNTPMPLLEEGDGYSQGKVVWDNAYGVGRDFQWTSTPHKLDKLLTLDTAPPVPAEYIIDGGNPTLRLSFIFDPSADLDIYVDGALWNKTTKVTTFNAIEFKKDGETLWIFNPVSCWDATGETQSGATTLRKSGNSLYIDALVSYEWLQTATYPVFIDPTLTVQPSSKDTYMQSGLPTANQGTGTFYRCGYANIVAKVMRPLVEFSISGLPAGATINVATMSMYYYDKAGTPAGNTHYAYRLLRRDWVESEATWNIYKTGSSWTTAGASGSGTDYTTTAGASTTVPADYGWMNWVITNQVITAYDNSWTVDCRIHSSAEATDESADYYSKEYTGDTLKRPKLVIDYTAVPVVDTAACSNPTASSLQANGEITDDGGATITRRGFVHAEGLKYALDFNGVSDYVDLPNDLGYTTQVSAFAWFKHNGTPLGNYHIIVGGQELEISIPVATGALRTGVYTNARYVSEHGSGLCDGNWHYIGFTFDGSTKKSYIDGIFVGEQTGITGALTYSFANRRMGRFGSSTAYYLNGQMDEVRIWSDVRTIDEIQANMYSELVGTEAGLVGYWKLNEGADTTAEDSTSNENDGTITGADWVYQGWDLKTMEDDVEQTEYDVAQKLYNGYVTRLGQKLPVLNGYIDSLSFYLSKLGSPSGDITFTVRDLDDNVLATKVWGDASNLTTSPVLEEVEFDAPIFVNEWVRILVEYSGGSAGSYVKVSYQTSSLTPIGYRTLYFGGWTDATTTDTAYVLGYTPYTYEDGSFSEGVYDLTIEGLIAETNYRVRAFAENSAGIGYGDIVTCQTAAEAAGYSFGVVIG